MLSLVSIFLTCLALILIPCLFIFRRPSFPLFLKKIIIFISTTASQYNDEEERYGTIGEKGKRGRMPKHVANKRGLRVSEGHEAGARTVLEHAMDCFAMGINTLSLFAFSTENWGRPDGEVNFLMAMFEKNFKSEMAYFDRYKVKISVIGKRTNMPQSLLGLIHEVEKATKNYKEKHLIMALDYSGRYDILQACKSLAEKTKNGLIQVEDINESMIDKELMTSCSEYPNPDLLIRTSGEQRISNFFLWQSAYTELYFSNVLWPDFGEAEYLKALTWYQQRQRRFGRRV
ncbi:dehydrodolichyl diphosphate synthase 5-like [Raphanus sativus]|uniref:Alkyl transferase n=1 Tax=Raphanus sativus TaxID=3726 RepID=A0A6J0MV27_RAPSA|nr:dehydrodolichyl diphosphate synthase 5-like [Raphanus sativus]